MKAIVGDLAANAERLRNEITETENEMQSLESEISSLMPKSGNVSYRLHASFVHSGNSQRGHWVIYIYDHKARVWRKYNDDHVTTVSDTSEILAHDPSRHGSGTSAIVVYVRSDGLDDFVETTYRTPSATADADIVASIAAASNSNQQTPSQLIYRGTSASAWRQPHLEAQRPDNYW